MNRLFCLVSFLSVVLFTSCSSCERSREIAEKKKKIALFNAEELEKAKHDFYVADSLSEFYGFELEDLKQAFVLEKNEQYQSKGFLVLSDYAGDKRSLDFFPEVEEEGQMLLVSVNGKREWRFMKIGHKEGDFLSSDSVKSFIGRALSDDEKDKVYRTYSLSEMIRNHNDAVASAKKNKLKIEYYEKKVGESKDSGESLTKMNNKMFD